MKRAENKLDRLVIDVFRPTGGVPDKLEKPESVPSKEESREAKAPPSKAEKVESKPSGPGSEPAKSPPAKVETTASKPPSPEPKTPKPEPPKVDDPPRAVTPEQPREIGGPPAKGGARLMEVRHWSPPDHTRVVADLEGTPAHEILPQEKFGMQTLNQSLASLHQRRMISMDDALGRSSDVDELRNLINQGGGAAVTRRAASAA